VGFDGGWNDRECARRSSVVWGARNGRTLLRLVCDTAAVRGAHLVGFRNTSKADVDGKTRAGTVEP
jgi:hypothetical protein